MDRGLDITFGLETGLEASFGSELGTHLLGIDMAQPTSVLTDAHCDF